VKVESKGKERQKGGTERPRKINTKTKIAYYMLNVVAVDIYI
jgi:hypothetical protein